MGMTAWSRERPTSSEQDQHQVVHLCSSFDEDCFLMTDEQHEMCAKSLPMYCGMTGVYCGEFDPKDGHCPFEFQGPLEPKE